jgi:hypothetical protein
VEDAQHDLLRKAHPPTVVTDEDAATVARDYPQLVTALNLDDTVLAELIGGQRDVFTAACADQLAGRSVTSLGELDTDCCEAYLAHRRYLLDENGQVVGERSPATRRAAAQTVVDLVNHRELFSLDRVPEDLRPWGGAAPSVVAEMPCGVGQNKTRPSPTPSCNRCWLQPAIWWTPSARTRST